MERRRKEDWTTEKLAKLLKSDVLVLSEFLRFLFPSDGRVWYATDLQWSIEFQYPILKGRIDLLIHTASVAIIIECKVDDGQKIFQLSKYHTYWSTHRTSKPLLFWLTRRRGGDMGRNPFLTRELLWNELHEHLLKCREAFSFSTRDEVDAFCTHLKDAGILLRTNESAERRLRDRGYNLQFAETLLDRIAETLGPDIKHEVVSPVNRVPHRLVLGRSNWLSKFEDGWIKRVVLRFKPAPRAKGGFTLSGAILLFGGDEELAISQFPRHAQICSAAGMQIYRNDGGKYYGEQILSPPFQLTRPARFAVADKLVPEDQLRVFTPDRLTAAVREGQQVIASLLAIVDQF